MKFAFLMMTLIVMTIPSNAQFKNPKNLEFTWRTDTTKYGVDLSEITLVLPKGTFPKIDFPSFIFSRTHGDEGVCTYISLRCGIVTCLW